MWAPVSAAGAYVSPFRAAVAVVVRSHLRPGCPWGQNEMVLVFGGRWASRKSLDGGRGCYGHRRSNNPRFLSVVSSELI